MVRGSTFAYSCVSLCRLTSLLLSELQHSSVCTVLYIWVALTVRSRWQRYRSGWPCYTEDIGLLYQVIHRAAEYRRRSAKGQIHLGYAAYHTAGALEGQPFTLTIQNRVFTETAHLCPTSGRNAPRNNEVDGGNRLVLLPHKEKCPLSPIKAINLPLRDIKNISSS